jgi:arabinofuranosyltransferase
MSANRRSSKEEANTRSGPGSRFLAVLHNPAALLFLGGVIPLVVLAFSRIELVDDAYIDYRYAHNLVVGQGLVFNPGEYVEGFTSLLWTLIMVAPEVFGLPIHIFAAFLGVGLGLLAMIDTWRICQQLGISQWGTFAAVAVLGLYPQFWLTLANGLEGGLFTFILVRLIYLLLCGKWMYSGIWGGLLFMTRPDSILILPLCTLYLYIATKSQTLPLRQRLIQPFIALLAPWLTLVVAVTLWRLAYYGAWLPNTITAKSMPLDALSFGLIGDNLSWGLRYFLGFLVSAAPFTMGAVLALIVEVRRRRVVWLLLGIVATQVPAVLINGGDWMPNFRLLAVYTPLLAITLGMAVDRIVATREPLGATSLRAINKLAIGLVFVAGIVFMLLDVRLWDPAPEAPGVWYKWHDVSPDFSVQKPAGCYQRFAEAYRPVMLPDDRVSPSAMGIFSYMFPSIYSHDRLGLTDKHVARYGTLYVPRLGKRDPAYTYYNIRPDLIVVDSGFGGLSPMARVSDGAYNEIYSTYQLTELPESCRGSEVMVSIQKDSVARILPGFAYLVPQPVTVPTD